MRDTLKYDEIPVAQSPDILQQEDERTEQDSRLYRPHNPEPDPDEVQVERPSSSISHDYNTCTSRYIIYNINSWSQFLEKS